MAKVTEVFFPSRSTCSLLPLFRYSVIGSEGQLKKDQTGYHSWGEIHQHQTVTMAELVARLPHDQKVVGSNPTGSKKI